MNYLSQKCVAPYSKVRKCPNRLEFKLLSPYLDFIIVVCAFLILVIFL